MSYKLVGIFFDAHNELGRFTREKQYGDYIEQKLNEYRISHRRELIIGSTGYILDFLIDNKIVVELKTKRLITSKDYFQIQRYLEACSIKLGLLVNFRSKYLSPKRIINTKI